MVKSTQQCNYYTVIITHLIILVGGATRPGHVIGRGALPFEKPLKGEAASVVAAQRWVGPPCDYEIRTRRSISE